MNMPGRTFNNGTGYAYGFDGKRKDNDIHGEGNAYDFDARIYDPRVGRWYSIDPVVKPWISPYQFGGDNPVNIVDMAGKDEIHFHTYQVISKRSDGSLIGNTKSSIEIIKANGPDRYFHHSHLTQINVPTANSQHGMTTSVVTKELHPWNDDSRSGITSNEVLGGLITNKYWGGDRDYVTLIKYINANPELKGIIEKKANDKKWDFDDANYKKILKDAPKYQTLENIKQGAELAATVISFADLGAGLLAPEAMSGRLGTLATRNQISQIASTLERRGYNITGGGGRFAEEYLKPLNRGRKGGSYLDITATHPEYGTLRINTVDVLSDGVTPTGREATNAARIRTQIAPDEHLLLIPKKAGK
jgi:RHS repeat-associated protein